MNTKKSQTFDLRTAQAAVQLDTVGALGKFLDGEFSPDRSIGQSQWQNEKSEFFAVRWRFDGQHTKALDGFGHTTIAATQNTVSVSGLTLVENTVPGQDVPDDLEQLLKSDTISFHRFIDWLAVFAQIGVLHLGRPMSISEINFAAPPPGKRRQPGYNDEAKAD
jgi:hypothetical protein